MFILRLGRIEPIFSCPVSGLSNGKDVHKDVYKDVYRVFYEYVAPAPAAWPSGTALSGDSLC